jgi:ParB family chromosome partitioning protein
MGHARALLAVDAASQIALANQVSRNACRCAKPRSWSPARWKSRTRRPAAPRQKEKSGDIVRLEEELSDKLATPVVFKMGQKGKGQMIIDFADLDVLESVLARLRA